MILAILGFFVLILVLGFIFVDETEGSIAGFGSVGVVVSLIFTVVLAGNVVNSRYIDEKIAMYADENKEIETRIEYAVSSYMEYENNTFTDLSPSSAIILVTLYPELKSDALVVQQISVYVSNNEKIKELKLQEINYKSKKWWLYFGG